MHFTKIKDHDHELYKCLGSRLIPDSTSPLCRPSRHLRFYPRVKREKKKGKGCEDIHANCSTTKPERVGGNYVGGGLAWISATGTLFFLSILSTVCTCVERVDKVCTEWYFRSYTPIPSNKDREITGMLERTQLMKKRFSDSSCASGWHLDCHISYSNGTPF